MYTIENCREATVSTKALEHATLIRLSKPVVPTVISSALGLADMAKVELKIYNKQRKAYSTVRYKMSR